MFDPVPWLVGGGAEHSPNVARVVAHGAFGGLQGVTSPTALVVRARAVPGSSVRISPGTVAVLNRATGAVDEMYVGRLVTEEIVNIAPTTAGSGRSDLIVVRIEDPNEPGVEYDEPANPAVGPYIFARVITGVPNTTTSAAQLGLARSEYALARIDIPPSTATITQAMVKDLRDLAEPARHYHRHLNVVSPTSKQNVAQNSGWVDWPSQSLTQVTVPEWATHLRGVSHIGGVGFGAAGTGPGGLGWTCQGNLRVQFNFNGTPTYSEATVFELDADASKFRYQLMTGVPLLAIPAAARGKTVTVRLECNRANVGTSAAELFVDAKSMISLDLEFYTAVEGLT